MSEKSYNAANDWLKKRVNVATTMDSATLAIPGTFPPKARAHAFFSAKVAEAHILDKLRSISDLHSSGKIGVGEARVMLKKFLWGNGYAKDGSKSMANLVSTARLNLILHQNASMAAAVGRHQVSHDPDIIKIWPYYRYIAHDDARNTHSALDGTVLPKNDPFWSTYTPPWEFNCRCEVEDCDAEEARQYGGVNKVVSTQNSDGTVNATLDQNGHTLHLTPSSSGFTFNPAHAFEEFDMSSIKHPALRLNAIEAAEIMFGDQVKRIGKNKVKFAASSQQYLDWKDHKLTSAKKWVALPVPAAINPANARQLLKKGITLQAADKTKVFLGSEVLDHWEIEPENIKLKEDVDGRLRRINWAITTVENSHEVWIQDKQRIYLQKFQKDTGGFRGCLVAVGNDNKGRSYMIKNVSGIDSARKGIKYKKMPESTKDADSG
jgi:SPP1 gp7 family putative phage head morphogenesis protein